MAAHASHPEQGFMKRIPELDAVRGLAAIVIVLYHVAPGVAPFGWLAVDFFLILSGYLITTILLKNQNDRRLLYNFYGRRSLRIWPIYYLTILGMAALVFLLRRYLPKEYSFEALPPVSRVHATSRSLLGRWRTEAVPGPEPHLDARARRAVLSDLADPRLSCGQALGHPDGGGLPGDQRPVSSTAPCRCARSTRL
jgi:hypothetical protein